MKRIISVLFVVLLLAVSVLPLTVSAAEKTETNYIYFEVPTEGAAWKNFNMIYCHMWSKLGGDIYAWQAKQETCEDMKNGYWRYDVSEIEFDAEGEYSLIFSNDVGMQTYNLNITSSCLGDIVYCKGDTTVNPVDGEKTCAVARWRNNGEKVHPAIEVDSNGKTLNVDEVDPQEIDTVWGEAEGASYDLPEITVAEKDDAQPTSSVSDDGEVAEDGINTNAATVWIISICAVVGVAIIIVAIVLAKKNKKNQ